MTLTPNHEATAPPVQPGVFYDPRLDGPTSASGGSK